MLGLLMTSKLPVTLGLNSLGWALFLSRIMPLAPLTPSRISTYLGAPSELAMRIGIAQAGPLQIELIQPITEQSAYRMSVPAGSGQGFHHIGIWTENFDQDLADLNGLGYETINAGRTRSTDFAYVDARPLLGCMLEIVTKTPLAERRFSEIATAAEDWQGDAPLRYA